ncbi:hypothetical protein HK102_012209 [Quaeritorhiza haematococci]|nr:hypothetical protein HK102_012209 [Quaeritorhiza haematococci]
MPQIQSQIPHDITLPRCHFHPSQLSSSNDTTEPSEGDDQVRQLQHGQYDEDTLMRIARGPSGVCKCPRCGWEECVELHSRGDQSMEVEYLASKCDLLPPLEADHAYSYPTPLASSPTATTGTHQALAQILQKENLVHEIRERLEHEQAEHVLSELGPMHPEGLQSELGGGEASETHTRSRQHEEGSSPPVVGEEPYGTYPAHVPTAAEFVQLDRPIAPLFNPSASTSTQLEGDNPDVESPNADLDEHLFAAADVTSQEWDADTPDDGTKGWLLSQRDGSGGGESAPGGQVEVGGSEVSNEWKISHGVDLSESDADAADEDHTHDFERSTGEKNVGWGMGAGEKGLVVARAEDVEGAVEE